jgi:hypothetical protein
MPIRSRTRRNFERGTVPAMLTGIHTRLAKMARGIPVLEIFTAVAFMLPVSSALAAECERQTAQELRRVGVAQRDVKSVAVVHRRGGGRAFNNYRINAWTRLHSCGGYVVVTLTPSCFVLQSSATGDCQVADDPQR